MTVPALATVGEAVFVKFSEAVCARVMEIGTVLETVSFASTETLFVITPFVTSDEEVL